MPAPLEVTLYGKPNCGLCDHAEAALARIGKRIPLRVLKVNIDADEALQARYFLAIPVVAVGDVEIARAPISERELERELRSFG
jgi:glutaredoxin